MLFILSVEHHLIQLLQALLINRDTGSVANHGINHTMRTENGFPVSVLGIVLRRDLRRRENTPAVVATADLALHH